MLPSSTKPTATTKPKPVRVILQMGLLAERVGTWLRSGVGAA